MRSFTTAPEVIILDIDSTDDPTHGQQQLSFFHGYYDQHMYHPLVIFDGERGQLVSAVPRPGNAHAARGAMGVLRRIIQRLKQRFPHVQIVVRGDSAFAVPRVLRMLEELNREVGGIAYVVGLAQNAVLLRAGATALSEARRRFQATKQTVQHFDAFAYAAESWPQARHVVMKAEVSEHGANPRFVVTSLPEFAPALLYHAYCERGQCENFIKDFKNALQADRLSCSTFAANFFRLLEHAAAYVLFHALRTQVAPLAPQLGRAQFDTLAAAALESSGHCLAVDAPGARAASVRVSVGASVPATGHDPRGAARPVLSVIVVSSQKVLSLFAVAPSVSREASVSPCPQAPLLACRCLRFSPFFLYSSLFVIFMIPIGLFCTAFSLLLFVHE